MVIIIQLIIIIAFVFVIITKFEVVLGSLFRIVIAVTLQLCQGYIVGTNIGGKGRAERWTCKWLCYSSFMKRIQCHSATFQDIWMISDQSKEKNLEMSYPNQQTQAIVIILWVVSWLICHRHKRVDNWCVWCGYINSQRGEPGKCTRRSLKLFKVFLMDSLIQCSTITYWVFPLHKLCQESSLSTFHGACYLNQPVCFITIFILVFNGQSDFTPLSGQLAKKSNSASNFLHCIHKWCSNR